MGTDERDQAEKTSGDTIKDWSTYINSWAHDKGFWEYGHGRAVIVEKVLLCISELVEAYETLRSNPDPMVRYYNDDENGIVKPEGFIIEIADTMIRLLDLCGELDINIETYMDQKMRYNEIRPYKHGRSKEST